MLRSWEGLHANLVICDQQGAELTSIWDVLCDHSSSMTELKFGFGPLNEPTALVPATWTSSSHVFAGGDTALRIVCPDGVSLQFTLTNENGLT